MIFSLSSLGSYSWVIIPFGLFLGLLGYRMYKLSLFIISLFIGIVLGSWVGEAVENTQLGLILGIVFGLFLGGVTQFLLRFSLFMAGLAGGIVIAFMSLSGTSIVPDSLEALAWYATAGLTGGLLTVFMYRTLVLFMTSLIGTYMIYIGVSRHFSSDVAQVSWILYGALLLVFILVQFSSRKGHHDPVDKEWERRRRR